MGSGGHGRRWVQETASRGKISVSHDYLFFVLWAGVHPRLHNGLQDINVGVSVHPKSLLKEMGRHASLLITPRTITEAGNFVCITTVVYVRRVLMFFPHADNKNQRQGWMLAQRVIGDSPRDRARPPQQLNRIKKTVPVTAIKNSRQQQDLAKAMSAAATFDQCCLVEWSADFHPVQYMMALEQMLGKSSVYQLMKMSGQILVGLASVGLAERLVEEGLTIGTTLLKVFPYRQRPENIIVGNLPLAIKDEDVVATLRPYCRVVSLTHEVVASGGYTWTTGYREAFILLNEGMKLHQLPAKLVIVSKGESTPAYITYGVRCSKCHRQGYRPATCSLGINGNVIGTPGRARCRGFPPPSPPLQQIRPLYTTCGTVCTLQATSRRFKKNLTGLHGRMVRTLGTYDEGFRRRGILAESQDKDLHDGMIPIEIVRPDASSPKPSGQLRRTTKESVTFVRNTRQQQALNKARSSAATFDQCCYVEWCADFHPVHYMKALEELLGKESVYQLMKMSGHVMVGLASIEKAERLVENGLTINNTFLRAFPYRRKAEKIILGNLPIAVREEDIIEALRPYCRVVSLAYEVVSCNGYTWTTGNREDFVLLNEGCKLHQLPAKLVIISKGESTHAYITYGVRCSRCHRQGHRRATCPQGTRSGPMLTLPASQPTPSHSLTATTSAEGNSGTIQTIPTASSPAKSCPVLSQNTPATKPSAPAEFYIPLHYIKALEMLAKGSVFQIMKMSGQVLVGLASVDVAERIEEEGFNIAKTLLKVSPYKKRAEKVMVGNIPIAVKDEDIVAALHPYCREASLSHEVV
ncbi:hypothetical protein LAZ67_17000507 [Cordylochernes scorpioides]|uniref:CCHC-type domain-containing protein n=1 Tax=Cordylochernes scorpioides TaxID=51811 RepID=A0ABY6LCR4_9ARAC|nr:hypothetical protein LAZ67_17000507 [Cordylochernes scorpioides]